jgi:hypothetical protein
VIASACLSHSSCGQQMKNPNLTCKVLEINSPPIEHKPEAFAKEERYGRDLQKFKISNN